MALLTSSPDIVGAAGNLPYDDMASLIAAAKAAPKTLLTGATFGSTSQFMWLILEDMTGTKFKYVPFDGTRERMTALLSHTIQLGTINVVAGKKYIQGGELKALGIAAAARSDQLPDLPTLREQGIDLIYALTRGIVVPKGTDRALIDHWAAAFEAAAADPGVLEQMNAKGTGVAFVGPEGYRAWFEKTYADHEKVAIKIGMYKK